MGTVPNYEGAKGNAQYIMQNSNGTSLTSALVTGPVTGCYRIKEIRVFSAGSTSPGSTKKLAIVKDDGTTQVVVEILSVNDTLNIKQAVMKFDNLSLKDGQSLKLQMTSSLTSGAQLHVDVEYVEMN